MPQVHELEAKEYGEPPSLRLTQTIDSNPVEVVAKVVGIIASKTLPPIRRLYADIFPLKRSPLIMCLGVAPSPNTFVT